VSLERKQRGFSGKAAGNLVSIGLIANRSFIDVCITIANHGGLVYDGDCLIYRAFGITTAIANKAREYEITNDTL